MDILFRTNKLQKVCNTYHLLQKKFGPRRAKLVRQRLDELKAVDSLDVMRGLPQARCHELKGNRAGQLSVDLDHPYRLILQPAHDPPPQAKDGGLDWSKVTAALVLEVADTHE